MAAVPIEAILIRPTKPDSNGATVTGTAQFIQIARTPPNTNDFPIDMAANDEVERRGVAQTPNKAHLSQSSTLSLAHRSCDPRDRSNRLLDERHSHFV